MELQKEFWDEFGRDLVIDAQGHVNFTQPGREKYAPLLAKWGYVLAYIRTVEDFRTTLRRVNALELEENNAKLLECLRDPLVPENEKDFIRKLLGPGAEEAALCSTLPRRKPLAVASRTAVASGPSQVVRVDFKARSVISRS